MAARKFTLEIQLGNDAMKTPAHVADALAKVTKQVPHIIMLKGGTVKILDENGNSVGSWKYE